MPQPQAVVPSRARQHQTTKLHYGKNIGDLLGPNNLHYLGQGPRADTSVQDAFHPRPTPGTFSSISEISPGVSMYTPQHDGSPTLSGMVSFSNTESGSSGQYHASDGSQNIESVQGHAVDSFVPINQASPCVGLQSHSNSLQYPIAVTDDTRFGHGQHQGTQSWSRTQPTYQLHRGIRSGHGDHSTRLNLMQAEMASPPLYSQGYHAADQFKNEDRSKVIKQLEKHATYQQHKGLGNLYSEAPHPVFASGSPKVRSPNPWSHMEIGPEIDPSTYPCVPGTAPNPFPPTQFSTLPYAHDPDDTIEPRPGEDPVGPPPGLPSTNHSGDTASGKRKRELSDEGKKEAAECRVDGSCWPCKLKRTKCKRDPNDPRGMCKGCRKLKRPGRRLECIPHKVYFRNLHDEFLPRNLWLIYQPKSLETLVSNGISGWTDYYLPIELTVGWGPSIKFPVREAIPKNDSLMFQPQYRFDHRTGQWPLRRMPSPVVGISRFDTLDLRRRLDRYLDNVMDNDLRGFPEQCFRGRNQEVYHDLFNAMYRFHVRDPQIKRCLRLIICTFASTYTWTLREETRDMLWTRLQYVPNNPYESQTSPRLFNMQLKGYLLELHAQEVFKMIQQYWRRLGLPCGEYVRGWAPTLIILITLCMTAESLQLAALCAANVHRQQSSETANLNIKPSLDLIDKHMNEFIQLFCDKYHRKGGGTLFNPVYPRTKRDTDLDDIPKSFASDIRQIIARHRPALKEMEKLDPPVDASEPRPARLLARILLSFEAPKHPSAVSSGSLSWPHSLMRAQFDG